MAIIIGMYGAGSGGTQDSLAVVDVPADGTITGVDWDVTAEQDADGETSSFELSFIATNQLATNDVRSRISSVGAQMSLTTSGIAQLVIQKFVGPMSIEVSGGERIHLHVTGSAGVGSVVRCNVHVEQDREPRRRSRRR